MAKIHLNKEVITDLEFCEDNVDENYDSCVKARTSLEMDFRNYNLGYVRYA